MIHKVIHVPSHLLKSRHGIYYYRLRVPTALRTILQRTEIRHSLRTGNLREAAKLCAALTSRYDSAVRQLHTIDIATMSPEEKKRRVRQLLGNGPFSTLQIEYFESGLPKSIRSDPNNEEDGRRALEAHQIVVETLTKSVPVAVHQPQVTTSPQRPSTLSELIEKFYGAMCTVLKKTGKCQSGWVTERARKERKAALDVLLELTGDIPLSSIDRQVIENAWNDLQTLPPNWKKSPKWRDIPLPQILKKQSEALQKFNEKNEKLSKSEREFLNQDEYVKFLSESTANNYAWNWSALFDWSSKQEYISRNHAEGLQLKRDKTRTTRKSYQLVQLRKIFESEHFSNRTADDPAKYWIPLLLLYTGARLNEMSQLVVDDIVSIDDIWSIKIWDDEFDRQQLKNQQSRRIIPIHSKLIELGFVEYAQAIKQRKGRKLFPSLDTGGEKHSKYIGNWWGRFLKVVGVKENGIDAHSFRHTAVTVWQNKKVDVFWASCICGHGYSDQEEKKKAQPITYAVYGELPHPSVLKEYVEMLDFGLNHQKYLGNLDAKPRTRNKSGAEV